MSVQREPLVGVGVSMVAQGTRAGSKRKPQVDAVEGCAKELDWVRGKALLRVSAVQYLSMAVGGRYGGLAPRPQEARLIKPSMPHEEWIAGVPTRQGGTGADMPPHSMQSASAARLGPTFELRGAPRQGA